MRKLLIIAFPATPLAAHAQDAVPAGTKAYQGGVGSPFSKNASNITGSDTRSEIAPRLPSPDASVDDVHNMLMSANRALQTNQTGAAQEALERAETRVLTRSTDPALANQPDTQLMAKGISDARMALGKRNIPLARSIVEHMLNPG